MEPKKIGCYICSGCGIGEALDVAKLTKVAAKEQKIPVVKDHNYLCSPEGVAMIKNDMATEGVNSLIIAACSQRVHAETFRFGTPVMDRVNLREQVVWVQEIKAGDATAKEDRQMLAEDYLRIGSTKIKKMNPPEPFQDPGFSKTILVVGGGVTGLNAAKEAADAGYSVVLVEKEGELGGKLRNMHKLAPMQAPYRDLLDNPLEKLVSAVESNARIKVYKNAQVADTRGAPGLFDVNISVNGEITAERIGSIVVATGYTPYDAEKLGHLGRGASPDVITAMEFELMAKAGNIVRKSDGQPAKKVAFVLCAGSRDVNHLEYCSGACCTYTMKQAMYVIEQYKEEASSVVIYQEIRTPGQMEDFYRKAQDEGVVFVKGDVTKVAAGSSGGVSLSVNDKLLRAEETIAADLVVLATGMVPNIDTYDPNEASAISHDREATRFKTLLNLYYRQGPSLPSIKWGFPDSHYICFPYETRRTGIYAAGPVRRPMGIDGSISDATGAALKAIQVVESIARGAAVHPRAGDLSYPSFNINGCTQCKRCTDECPFGAINEDEKGNPQFNPTRCRRCGTCMGACPQKIISFANYSVDMIGSMIKAVDVPCEDDEKPRILILACENDAYPAMDMVGFQRSKMNPYIRVIPIRCLGSTNLVWIADALSSGFDGVMLMGCRHGEDYQCHFMRGSALAEIRLSKISETLGRLKLEPTRVKMVEVNIMDADRLPGIVDSFAKELEALGANPFKPF
ncbi:MAG: hydrogenase iron-sulfur subunit [Magnetococcales bacterium]|nr:hydrogenase iron-sulfur subunit [Magnetococcales bacterium]NGZ25894.1 hydrogenase iron-sulfur subunit [Magnetococcales bacterium]